MTTSVSNINRANLNLLDPNLAINQIADPALRKACFDEIYNYLDTFVAAYNAFIAAGGIATANLADLSVTTAKMALLSVTAAQIANATITATQLADGAVTSAKILDGTIATTDLADAIITTAKLALLSVTTGQLADSSVTSAKIVDLTITTGDIADSAITSAKIADGTIVNADINAAAAIDASKLANLSITSAQIADGAIMNVDINASAAIDAAKIGGGLVSNTEFGYLDGVTGPIQTQLTNATLGAIADGSITDVKLDNGGSSVKAKANAALPSASYTAADVLTKIKTVDGAGSGLDADLFDGLDSLAYVKADGSVGMTAPLQFSSVEGAKINLFGSTFGFAINNAELTAFMPSNCTFTLRQTSSGTVIGEVFHQGNVGTYFPNSKAANGYQKLPGGLILQWFTTASLASNTLTTVNFPIAFPNACFNAVATPVSTSSAFAVSAAAPTTTGVSLITSGVATVFVRAIGW